MTVINKPATTTHTEYGHILPMIIQGHQSQDSIILCSKYKTVNTSRYLSKHLNICQTEWRNRTKQNNLCFENVDHRS